MPRSYPPSYEIVLKKIQEIEDMMEKLGYWQTEPLAPEAYDFKMAFGIDTMAFSQWLQFILVPRVHEIIETKGEFPPESHVAAQAVRELSGDPEGSELVRVLAEFDDLFGKESKK
jgi:uncharacterized protein YqcC (DUF446 family)